MLIGAAVAQAYLRFSVQLPARVGRDLPMRELARRTWPFFIGNLTMQLKSLDTTIVAVAASSYGAGLYAAASKLTTPFLFVPTALTQVVLPRATQMNSHRARSVGRKLYAVCVGLLIAALPLMLLGDEVMVILFGPQYAGAGPILALTLAGMPFFALASALGALLQGRNDEKYVATNGALTSVLLLAGAAAGAAVFGALGAAALVSAALVGKSISLAVRLELTTRPEGDG